MIQKIIILLHIIGAMFVLGTIGNMELNIPVSPIRWIAVVIICGIFVIESLKGE